MSLSDIKNSADDLVAAIVDDGDIVAADCEAGAADPLVRSKLIACAEALTTLLAASGAGRAWQPPTQ